MRNNNSRMNFFAMGTLAVIFLMVGSSLLGVQMQNFICGETDQQSPSSSAAISQSNTFPSPAAQLLVNTSYNFTTGLRDNSTLNRGYEGAYLTINKDGEVLSNTTFTPMGTFPGAISFENDMVGGLAAGWIQNTYGTASISVEASYLGHKKVLRFYDGSTAVGNYFSAKQTFTEQISGTYACWFAQSDVAQRVQIPSLFDPAGATANYMYFSSGNLVNWYRNATEWVIGPVSSGRWHYLQVEFDCTSKMFNVSLDGVPRVMNLWYVDRGATQCNNVTYVGVDDGWTGYASTFYLDTIDFSWDTGYVANRSMHDLGQLGIYNAMNSFENDAPFTIPEQNCGVSQDAVGDIAVYPSVPYNTADHRDVLRMRVRAAAVASIVNLDFPDITSGDAEVEFWAYYQNKGVNNIAYHMIYQTGAPDVSVYARVADSTGGGNAWLEYAEEVSDWPMHQVMQVSLGQWYHHRFVVHPGTGSHTGTGWFDWYVNGVLKVSHAHLWNTTTSIGYASFGSYNSEEWYLDGLDVLNASGYYSGRNSYMTLEQNLTFAAVGSYSHRYTLSSSGTEYPGSWTPFTVAVPEEPTVPEHTILFSASSGDLLGVPAGAASLFVDSNSRDWGAVELLNGTHNITARDYFGDVLFSQNVTFVTGGFYSIPVTLATLVVNNYQGEPLSVEITKTGCSGTFRQLVGAQDSIVVRLASATYRVRAYNLRGDLVGEQASVVLTPGANQQVDFGTPAGPFTLEWMILAGILALCAILLVVANARIGGKGGRDEYRFLEGPTKEDKRAKMAAYVAPEAATKAAPPEVKTPAPAPAPEVAKVPSPSPEKKPPLLSVTIKPDAKPAPGLEKLSPIDPRREWIKQIDKDIDFLYALVRTLDAQFGLGQITNDLYLQQKNAIAEKIGELTGKKEQFLSEKPEKPKA